MNNMQRILACEYGTIVVSSYNYQAWGIWAAISSGVSVVLSSITPTPNLAAFCNHR